MKKIFPAFLSVLFFFFCLGNTALARDPLVEKQFAHDNNYILLIDASGNLWARGWLNKHTLQRKKPAIIMRNVRSITSNGGTVMVIKKDGSLWGFGNSYYGELGIRTEENYEKLPPRKILPRVKYVQIDGAIVFAIKPDNSLWLWGAEEIDKKEFTLSKSHTKPRRFLDNVKMAATSGYATMALKNDGTLWMWGHNTCGNMEKDLLIPRKVDISGLQGRKIIQIAMADRISAVVTDDGHLWAWAPFSPPSLECSKNQNPPTLIKEMSNVKEIAIGYFGITILQKNGKVFESSLRNYYPEKFEHRMDDVIEIAPNLARKKDGTIWLLGNEPEQIIFPKKARK